MINSGTELSGSKKMHGIQICDVHPPCVRCRTIGPVLLNMHPEKANVRTVDFFESKQSFRSIRKLFWKISVVHESGKSKLQVKDVNLKTTKTKMVFTTHRFLIPGLTSTILSELETTLMATSPAPASFFFK